MCKCAYVVVFLIYLMGCSDHAENKVNSENKGMTNEKPISENPKVKQVLDSYSNITEAFVQWDSTGVKQIAFELKVSLDSLDANPEAGKILHNLISQAKKNTLEIAKAKGIMSQRHHFDSLSKTLYDVFKSGELQTGKVYLKLCPMAFNDTDSAYWFSKNNNIRNPYLGLHHPRYHGGMLVCGENIDSINF